MKITDIAAALVEAGWHNGEGAATDPISYRRAEALAVDLAALGAPVGRAHPTLEGGIELAWSPPGREVSVNITPGDERLEVVVVKSGERSVQTGHVLDDNARGVMAFAGFGAPTAAQ